MDHLYSDIVVDEKDYTSAIILRKKNFIYLVAALGYIQHIFIR